MPNEKYGISLTGPDGGPYQVQSFALAFNRNLGGDGRPSSKVDGGTISFTVLITPESKLLEQMINAQNKPMATGKIEVTTAQLEGVYRTIEFNDAYIVNYQENFNEGGSEYPVNFVISAEKISIGNAKLDNKWPKKS